MTTGTPESDSAGFTVVFCSGAACASSLPVRERLGEAVRSCPHGMLVGADCLRGPTACAGSTPARPTPVVLAQRCTGPDRRPVGPAVALGPLCSHADLESVCAWLHDPVAHPIPVRSPHPRDAAALN